MRLTVKASDFSSIMRVFVSVVVFLTAVFTQENPMQCEMCWQVGTNIKCSGPVVVCPPNDTECPWLSENQKDLGDPMDHSPFQVCRNPSNASLCGKSLFFNCPRFFLEVTYDCCDTDDCKDTIQGPYEKPKQPNGYMCPAYFCENYTINCIPEEQINCTGNQNECLFFNGTAQIKGRPDNYYEFHGCVSPNGCDVGLNNLPAFKPLEYDLKCTPAKKVEESCEQGSE